MIEKGNFLIEETFWDNQKIFLVRFFTKNIEYFYTNFISSSTDGASVVIASYWVIRNLFVRIKFIHSKNCSASRR